MKSKKITSCCLVIVTVLTFVFLSVNKKTNAENIDWSQIRISFIQTSYPIFDLNNKAEYVGFSDYVFVGKVEKVTYGGKYSNNIYYPKGSYCPDDAVIPYTEYEVTVLKNIKGQLKTDHTITIKKHAGINVDTNVFSVLKGDVMPIENEEYVFLTRATKNGELVILDPHGNIALSDRGNNVLLNEDTSLFVDNINTTTSLPDKSEINITTTNPVFSDSTVSTEKIATNDSVSKNQIIDSYITAYTQETDPANRSEIYMSIYDVSA